MALRFAPFGTYVAPTEILIQTGQDKINAMLDEFMSLMPVIVGGTESSESSAQSPDFFQVTRHHVEKMQAEIDAIKVLVDAMPIA